MASLAALIVTLSSPPSACHAVAGSIVTLPALTATGDEGEQAGLLAKALELRAEGGTDFYTCGARALAAMKPLLDGGQHLPAIVIMTDGKSQGVMSTFELPWRADGRRVPVFGVTFGDDADRSQLDALARLTGGRVFDGTKSLMDAFRAVRGYN